MSDAAATVLVVADDHVRLLAFVLALAVPPAVI
jgi:hypothetical protein